MIHVDGLDILAPSVELAPFAEVEAFGAAVWLWMHSDSHRIAPLHTLPTLLLPPIKHRQFLIAFEKGKPVAYVSWAMFSQEAEQRYLNNLPITMPEADWCSGDRQWILDWVTPFGHSLQIARLMKNQLLPRLIARGLDHHGRTQGMRIIQYAGANLTRAEIDAWHAAHPVSLPSKV